MDNSVETNLLGNAIIPAGNVLVHDPGSIDTLREGGKNTLFITWPVWLQLKEWRNRPEIGVDAKECIARIEELRKDGDPSLVIWKKTAINGIKFLSSKDLDDQVIAAAISVKKEFKSTKKFQHFKFLCRDPFSRTTAREVDNNGLVVENYHHDRVEIDDIPNIKRFAISEDDFYTDDFLIYRPETFGEDIDENEGIICQFNNGDEIETFAAIKKGFYFQIIPEDIAAFGIKPRLLFNGGINWAQYIAFQQLLDQEIKLVFLEGSAGTGKTVIALACALAQKNLYTQIALTRPMVPLEDEDKMGFLPGKVEDKMDPWIRPLWTALGFLADNQKVEPPKSESKKEIEKKKPEPKKALEKLEELESEIATLGNKYKIRIDRRRKRKEKKKEKIKEAAKNYGTTDNGRSLTVGQLRLKNNIIIEPLGYIRGMTLPSRSYLILDEGQNTTPHAIKTIITRAGEGTKIVITGDLSQVDVKSLRRLDRNSNGLAHAMAKMKDPLVATTRFESSDSVRSLLAKLATERL